MEHAAFAAKVEFSDPDALGTVYVNDACEINLRDELANGKGYFITSDPAVIARLDAYEPLKRAAVTEAEAAQEAKAKSHSDKTEPKGRTSSGGGSE